MNAIPSAMRAIVNTGPGQLEWAERPVPKPGPDEVLIRTAVCGICATDLEMIAGWKRTGFPAIPGHEWAGHVAAVGPGVPDEWLGRACVGENVRVGGGEVGFEHPGGYAPFFITEARLLHSLPVGFPFPAAALIEPLAVVERGLTRWRPEPHAPILVLGDGPIGLLITLALQSRGFDKITLLGGRSSRLTLGLAMGAWQAVNYHDFSGAPADELRRHAPDGFPAICEASGKAEALEWAMTLAARGGRLLVLGDYGAACSRFPWNTLLHRELELIGSNASAGGWERAVAIAVREKERLARLVTHRLPASRFAEAVELVRDRSSGSVKVVLEWEGSDAHG